MDAKQLNETILNNLTGTDSDMLRWDALQPTDADYMMYSQIPV